MIHLPPESCVLEIQILQLLPHLFGLGILVGLPLLLAAARGHLQLAEPLLQRLDLGLPQRLGLGLLVAEPLLQRLDLGLPQRLGLGLLVAELVPQRLGLGLLVGLLPLLAALGMQALVVTRRQLQLQLQFGYMSLKRCDLTFPVAIYTFELLLLFRLDISDVIAVLLVAFFRA